MKSLNKTVYLIGLMTLIIASSCSKENSLVKSTIDNNIKDQENCTATINGGAFNGVSSYWERTDHIEIVSTQARGNFVEAELGDAIFIEIYGDGVGTYQVDTTKLPGTAYMTFREADSRGFQEGISGTVTITGFVNDKISGTFSGDLVPGNMYALDSITIRNGSFEDVALSEIL